jgi:hypothetical protein
MRLFPAGSAPCLLVAVAVTDILLGAAVLGAAVGARDGTRAGITVASGGGGSGGEVRFRLGETGLVRRDGRRYYESGGDLDAATLNPGETVEGTVTFDVPDQHGVVVYAPGFGRVLGSWQF